MFRKLLVQFPYHGVLGHFLLKYFYVSLDAINKGVADQLVREEIMKQKFSDICELLDDMTKINRAWYSSDDLIFSTQWGPSKE